MVGVLDVILDVMISIFEEQSNNKIDNSSMSNVKKNILKVLIVLASLSILMIFIFLSIKLFGKQDK